MKIPGFLLRRLYVKGSLKGTRDGFEFQLRNRLGSGYAQRLLPLTLDGQELDMTVTTFEVDGARLSFAQVSKVTPFTLAMNKITTIRVQGILMDSSPHNVGMRFEVAGLGELGFDFTDIPAASAHDA
jgi:hypothetical protein